MDSTRMDNIVYGIRIDDNLVIDKINDQLIEKIKECGILNELDIDKAIHEKYYSDSENLVHIFKSPMDNKPIIIGKILMSIHKDDDSIYEINVLTEHEKHVIRREIKREFGVDGKCKYYNFPIYY